MKYKKRQDCFFENEPALSSIPRRIFAILIDIVIIMFIFYLILIISKLLRYEIKYITWKNFNHIEIGAQNMSEKSIQYLKIFLAFVPTIYFVLTTYLTNGQSIGKKLLGIRIVSIYHHRISLWHCIERSLGYVASTLELGVGFIQIFWNPNRMTLHDRIAETLVVKI